ncbi:MAG: hypothetical protein QNL43_10390 [Crocinitomicaceae bacterium]|tara:strand:- start:18356 stop:18862 length:507 start_codon:yes stop_codon:yes gene_type:complete
MKAVSVFEYSFEPTVELSSVSEENDVLLWIFHVDKRPPHIGISSRGMFFSLKSNGKDVSKCIVVNEVVDNKSIKCVKVKLRFNISLTQILGTFDSFTYAMSSDNSCLSPIKIVLEMPSYIMKLADLLKELERRNKIEGWVSKNVKKKELGILKYSLTDIDARLNQLHD